MLNWIFDSAVSLVGDNTNKGTAPTLGIYRRLLVITPTRAVQPIFVLYMLGLLVITPTRAVHLIFVLYMLGLLVITPTRARQKNRTMKK
jgi:hypothetical protein